MAWSKTVTVNTPFGLMDAPRGFGADYRRRAKDHAEALAKGRPVEVIGPIVFLLEMVGVEVAPEDVSEWTAQQRVEAEAWAAREHLIASDNPLQRHPSPSWLSPRCNPDPDPGQTFGETARVGSNARK